MGAGRAEIQLARYLAVAPGTSAAREASAREACAYQERRFECSSLHIPISLTTATGNLVRFNLWRDGKMLHAKGKFCHDCWDVRLGLVEEGKLRKNQDGVMERVWQSTALLHMAMEYQDRMDIAFEAAYAIVAHLPEEDRLNWVRANS
jgi:hypothetical protein